MRSCLKPVILCLSLWLYGFGLADAWVKEHQPFPDGEATVVLHWFCQRDNCRYPTVQEQWWQDLIPLALVKWNAVDANFMFHTRPLRSTDDPCNLPGEVVVILTEDGRLCPGDGPMKGEANTITGRTEYRPWPNSARVYIKAPDDFLSADREAVELIIGSLLLHEFGHVVGLGHPNQAGQQVSSVMNSNHSPFDQYPLADDIAGVQAFYGTQPEPEALVGFLENPRDGSSQSGVGVISGWVCEAETVEVMIWSPDGGRVDREPAAYGTERTDTAYYPDGTRICGDTDNGFGLLFNWNSRGDGDHVVDVLVDGELLDRATITVTTLDGEFPRGLSGSYVLEDFPYPGESVTVEWEEALQNFVITEKR